MKILHTSDWHLGQKFLFRDRDEEHERALNWLLDVIQEEAVDLLIVAGDIFDIGNPPNTARRLYYQFLTRLTQTHCRFAVIVGGNHDSPSMLEAPKELLAHLHVHVVGAARSPEDEVIPLRDAEGNLEAVVAAVPFLRDRDLRSSQAGETGAERVEQIRAALKEHYHQVGEAVRPYGKKKVPLIVTGHLYASGAEASADQTNIYIGDKENIRVTDFPDVFHYVALGHIHRQQTIGGQQNVRYSGSLIPLSFSETKDDKSVLLLTFEQEQLLDISVRELPIFRRLKSISGSLPEVEEGLRRFAEKGDRGLLPWVEVAVTRKNLPARLDLHLKDWVKDWPLELVKIKVVGTDEDSSESTNYLDNLEDLDVQDVFERRLEQAGLSDDEQQELKDAFSELRNWYQQLEADG